MMGQRESMHLSDYAIIRYTLEQYLLSKKSVDNTISADHVHFSNLCTYPMCTWVGSSKVSKFYKFYDGLFFNWN